MASKYFGHHSGGVSEEIITHCIFPFVSSKHTFSSISKQIRGLVLSEEAACYWKDQPLLLCIDSYCSPTCPLKRKRASTNGALSLLCTIPVITVQMHCFITDIKLCLLALSHRGTIQSLHLTVSNRANSPPLVDVIPNSLTSEMFSNMRELVLDSSHLQQVKPEGRIKLLRLLGKSLTTLSFIGLSPPNPFFMLNQLCPALQHLRVDSIYALEEFSSFENHTITHLELCRANIIVKSHVALSALKIFRYSSNAAHPIEQYHHMIMCLPHNLVELSLEISSADASDILSTVSLHLSHLERFRLEGAYQRGIIGQQALFSFCQHCKTIRFLDIHSISVATLSFEEHAFRNLSYCPLLSHVRVMFEDVVLADIPVLLERLHQANASRLSPHQMQISLWERSRWCPQSWAKMKEDVQRLSAMFPCAIVELIDIS